MFHVFDLDDTLVQYTKHKGASVSRQTFQCLRALKAKCCTMGIISFNPIGYHVAKQVGLTPFFFSVNNMKCSSHLDRQDLMYELLEQIGEEEVTKFDSIHYWDDRVDNIAVIKHFFPAIHTHHVVHPSKLYKELVVYCEAKKFCKSTTCFQYQGECNCST